MAVILYKFVINPTNIQRGRNITDRFENDPSFGKQYRALNLDLKCIIFHSLNLK